MLNSGELFEINKEKRGTRKGGAKRSRECLRYEWEEKRRTRRSSSDRTSRFEIETRSKLLQEERSFVEQRPVGKSRAIILKLD